MRITKMQARRLRKRLTQEQLGEALGIPQSSIAGYESRVSTPSYRVACKIADILGLHAEELFESIEMPKQRKKRRPGHPIKGLPETTEEVSHA